MVSGGCWLSAGFWLPIKLASTPRKVLSIIRHSDRLMTKRVKPRWRISWTSFLKLTLAVKLARPVIFRKTTVSVTATDMLVAGELMRAIIANLICGCKSTASRRGAGKTGGGRLQAPVAEDTILLVEFAMTRFPCLHRLADALP